tara:strand:- start:2117 stop:2635 length:519 start_codon:yes stop_codon:yes gene_type:complete
MNWKNILKKDSRITSHQREGKKEIDRRYLDSDPVKRGALEELDGEQVASAGKRPRPKPYTGARGESNREMGDYDTAERDATAVVAKFFEDYTGDENFRYYALNTIANGMEAGRNDDQIKLELANHLKDTLNKVDKFMKLLESEGVEYKFINWSDVAESMQPELEYLSHLRKE